MSTTTSTTSSVTTSTGTTSTTSTGTTSGPETRRQLRGIRLGDLLDVVGAAVAAFALTGLLASQVLPINHPMGFGAVGVALFVLLYALLVGLTESSVMVRDRLVAVVVHGLAGAVILVLAFVVVFTVARGASALPHLNFFTDDMAQAGPLDPLDRGGIWHAIVGTLLQIAIALVITVPLGLLTALFLSEMPGRLARLVRTVVEAMTALPSIVAGLFVYATLILALGVPKSGVAAATAISIMMLPIMVRSSDVVLRLVPGTLKEASYALGAGQLRTVTHVVLPTARSGLTTAVILATARGIGETSPVLLTSGFTAALNADPTQGPMVSLPLAIFQFVKSPEPTMVARGFGTAAVLMLLVLLLFVVARVVGGRTPLTVDAQRRRREQRRAALAAAWRSELQRTRALLRRGRGQRPSPVPVALEEIP